MIFNYNKYEQFSSLKSYKKNKIVLLSNNYYKCIKSVSLSPDPSTSPEYWVQVPDNELLSSLKTNLDIGNNLKFKEEVNYIIPYIVLDNETGNNGLLYIWDVKIKPVSTPYSHGFIQTPNFIHIWLKNKNSEKSKLEIERIMRRYLLPYNTTFKNIYLELNSSEETTTGIGDFNEDFNEDFNI